MGSIRRQATLHTDMSQLGSLLFDAASWPLYLAASIFILGIWVGRHRWRQRQVQVDAADAVDEVLPLAGGDAPTVRVGGSERIDRLHRVVTLDVGEHADLLDMTFDRIPRLRIALIGIEQVEAHEYAQLRIELGGATAGCGSLVKEVGTNEFLVPRATPDEHRSSILHFHGRDDIVNFLRVKIIRIDSVTRSADIDVLHVCGHWTE